MMQLSLMQPNSACLCLASPRCARLLSLDGRTFWLPLGHAPRRWWFWTRSSLCVGGGQRPPASLSYRCGKRDAP